MFDGIFIRNLVSELKCIENLRINKFGVINNSEFYLTLSRKINLLISINSNSMNMRLSKIELINSTIKNSFQLCLKKYLESSIIKEISQYKNDRIIILDIIHYDDLGYSQNIKLIIEFFGRNSNICLIDDSMVIIDCYKRCLEADGSDNRIILPKAKYTFPIDNKINPFEYKELFYNNCYQGVSSLLYNEIISKNSLDIINNKVNPVLIKANKNYFYCFNLEHLDGDRIYFNTLSELLENFYLNVKKDYADNREITFLKNYINKEIVKITKKIVKQTNELQTASSDMKYEELGNLLLSNLHLCKKGDKYLKVNNFYNNNKEITITLDPLLTPNENVTHFFKLYQKAKRAKEQIKIQIDLSNNDLNYYKCLLNQISISKINDLLEIYDELNIKLKNKKPKKSKPNITTYVTDDGDYIYVGKNNIQNNYLTNSFARKTDYFFHVQNVPGSHVIVRTNKLTDNLCYLCSCIASFYSSYKESTNVCVDYTLIKNVKKIPGQKGSFVTYKNQKSVFGKPDIEFINKHTKLIN